MIILLKDLRGYIKNGIIEGVGTNHNKWAGVVNTYKLKTRIKRNVSKATLNSEYSLKASIDLFKNNIKFTNISVIYTDIFRYSNEKILNSIIKNSYNY